MSQPTKVSDSNFTQTSLPHNNDNADYESGNHSDESNYMDTEITKVRRPPPIIIKKTANWLRINRDFAKNEIEILFAKTVGDNIKIHPATSTDYRQISKYLDDKKHPFFTYQLQEDKKLKIVLRSIPNGINDEEILYELKELGYPHYPHYPLEGWKWGPANARHPSSSSNWNETMKAKPSTVLFQFSLSKLKLKPSNDQIRLANATAARNSATQLTAAINQLSALSVQATT